MNPLEPRYLNHEPTALAAGCPGAKLATNSPDASAFGSLVAGFLMLLTLACVAGCGGAPDGMTQVSGAVTWNGQPLETGFVTFAAGRSKSPQAGKIENGRYRFNAHVGQNVVRIHADKKGAFNEGMNQYVYHQFIPAKFNDQSELSAEVSSEGDNVFDFSLTGE
jgi:hypothetical protein